MSCVGLFGEFHKNNKKKIKNYFEVVLKSKFSNLKKIRKNLYNQKEKAWKVDLVPEYPKNPDIVIYNKYKKNPIKIAKKIMFRVSEKYERNFK